jgi:6-phosphogluconolactonase
MIVPACLPEAEAASVQDAAEAIACEIAAGIAASHRYAGGPVVALSGGSTPESYLPALAQQNVDWAAVTLCLADERWVETGDPRSNESAVRRYLGPEATASAHWITPWRAKTDPAAAAAAYSKALDEAAPFGLSLVVLGLGEDGHTASLFPASAAVLSCAPWAIAVEDADTEVARISLTPAALTTARRVIVIFSGATKSAVWRAARHPGAVESLPIRLLGRRPPGTLRALALEQTT